MPFPPEGMYLPPLRNGVLMMSSDLRDSFWAYLAECLYTAGVVLHMSVNFADRAAFLPSLPSVQSSTAYAGGFADRAASLPSLPSDQSSIAYAGRPGDRATAFVLLLYSALCR